MNYSITIHLDANRKLTYTQDQLSNVKKNGSYGSSGFPIGNVAITSFQFECPATGVHFDDDLPRAKVEFEIDGGLVDVFFIDHVRMNFEATPEQKEFDRMTVYCFDRLAFSNQPFEFERPYNSIAPVGYCTFWEAYSYCLTQIDLFSLNPPENMDYYLSLENDYTIRDVLGHIAAANGGNFCIRADELFFDMFGINGSILTPLDYTRPQQSATFGCQCEYIVLSNGDETVTIGEDTASPVNTVNLNIPVHKNNLTSIIADLGFNVRFRIFIPFSVSKAKFEVDTLAGFSQTISMGDRVNVGIVNSNWNIETQEFRTNYPIVCNLALSYTSQGVYGTVSAPDINETMGAFTYDKDRNKLLKEKNQGTVKYGNKYGIKSTGRREIVSVGADTPTQKTELQVYNGEIIFADTTDSANIVQAGKIYVDENKQLKIDGLTLTAEISLPSAGWSATAPYTQTVELEGIKKTDKPICDVLLDDNDTLAKTQLENWYNINKNVADETIGTESKPSVGTITFTCFDDKPSVDLNVSVKVVR